MSEKVKVSKQVAEFLRECENSGDINWEDALLKGHSEVLKSNSKGEAIKININALCICEFTNFELARILVLGYEAEETPEEILLKEYMKYFEDDSYQAGYEEGIFFTLNVLNIKIKGINE